MRLVMEARKRWSDATFYHGFHDCAEVHHEIETFIYFQLPLFNWDLPGADLALASIRDVAHHLGNWETDVPDWYDWDRHEFVSMWLGTREVRNHPPYDYQEANHFRFIDTGIAEYLGTGEERYIEQALDYANRWCTHIESLAERSVPIRCSILPTGAEGIEMKKAGRQAGSKDVYKTFYNVVSDNTAYDIAGALLDLYRLTGESRYVRCSQLLMDQFFDHRNSNRPANLYSEETWHTYPLPRELDPASLSNFVTNCTFLARFAVRHDMITASDRYRKPVLDWANAIDEETNKHDQMMANVLVAAHYYDGDPARLFRAYAMALRLASVVEENDAFSQCNWIASRQGTKFLMELLYQPILGGPEWGTRGSMPHFRLEHQSNGKTMLPPDVAFRTWRVDDSTDGFEARNLSSRRVAWHIRTNRKSDRRIAGLKLKHNGKAGDGRVELEAGESVEGAIEWQTTD